MDPSYMIATSVFVLMACCYLLFLLSETLEDVGARLGHLLKLPEAVIASTFQALATSGPEIIMAVLAATAFVSNGWEMLELGEKASSGTLNMAFSAMDNLIGIGCLGIIFMISRGSINPQEKIRLEPAAYVGLSLYVIASGAFYYFMRDAVITSHEGWMLMYIGIFYVALQFILPHISFLKSTNNEDDDEGDEELEPFPTTVKEYFGDLIKNGFAYAFLVFALIVFVRECLGATFNVASLGIVSVGGILIMFTSYVSSFPEFMMSFRYAIADKKSALLGMLFGSNVIDLAFAGFRSIWTGEDMAVYTTGAMPQLLEYYILALPVLAVISLFSIGIGAVRYKVAYPMMVFYICYIVSGFVLL